MGQHNGKRRISLVYAAENCNNKYLIRFFICCSNYSSRLCESKPRIGHNLFRNFTSSISSPITNLPLLSFRTNLVAYQVPLRCPKFELHWESILVSYTGRSDLRFLSVFDSFPEAVAEQCAWDLRSDDLWCSQPRCPATRCRSQTVSQNGMMPRRCWISPRTENIKVHIQISC